MARAYLDYYGEEGIIPVRQDLSDLDRHFRRRRALLRHLGLPPGWLAGAAVIEFGPGTGDNAIYTASLRPGLLTLVDGNPASVAEVRQRIADGRIGGVVECHGADIRAYVDDRRYDLVMCEGVIQHQPDAAALLRRVAGFVRPGGALIVTVGSPVSVFAEICRRALTPLIAPPDWPKAERIARLADFFRPDLASLPGMSRLPEDWILDNILHPWSDALFPLPEAVRALQGEFYVQGSSPVFMTDWRWYKSICDTDDGGFNDLAVDRYEQAAVAMLDYRVTPADLAGPVDGRRLDDLCATGFRLHHRAWAGDSVALQEFLSIVAAVRDVVAPGCAGVAQDLDDYLSGAALLRAGAPTPDFGGFRPMFGRGQQYVSFIRL